MNEKQIKSIEDNKRKIINIISPAEDNNRASVIFRQTLIN
jgi:hypothetical protein